MKRVQSYLADLQCFDVNDLSVVHENVFIKAVKHRLLQQKTPCFTLQKVCFKSVKRRLLLCKPSCFAVRSLCNRLLRDVFSAFFLYFVINP